MGTSWTRGIDASSSWLAGVNGMVALSAGQTLLRVRFRWGFYADTAILTDLAFVSENLMTWGIVTTIGNGTETVPNARTASGDADPPSERWIYWETRAPTVAAISNGAGMVAWRDSGSTEETSTKGQVLAPTMPAGDSLNVWASWAAPFNWDSSGTGVIWYAFSALIKT